MPRAKITAKGQITIPKQIREELGVEPGDALDFYVTEGHVEVRPIRRRSLAEFEGILAVENPPPFTSWEDQREQAWREATRRYVE